eukprot:7999027-Pyramimonas_sp.AAC.1
MASCETDAWASRPEPAWRGAYLTPVDVRNECLDTLHGGSYGAVFGRKTSPQCSQTALPMPMGSE